MLHGIFHPDGEPFRFDWDWLAPSGLSTKDFVAPSSLCFGTAKTFGLGGKYGAVSFLQILAPELSDEMLADFLKTESGILVNLHVQAIDQTEAIKTIKRKITDLDAMKIQEQKKAVRSGYDMDILPSDLATYGEDAKKLLNKLQTRNERLFMLTFFSAERGRHQAKAGQRCVPSGGRGAEVQLLSCPAGLPAGTGPCIQPSAGYQPDKDSAQPLPPPTWRCSCPL